MNLNYSILWFDDSEDYCKSLDTDPLKEKISSWGLDPQITFVNTAQQFEAQQPFDRFDLIVMDFNLDGEGFGNEFIANVREKRIYTEVIFYSAERSEVLWEKLAKNELEGVFIANRPNVTTKVEAVAHQSLKKVLDVENMRGIVMAEVGDIDHTLEAILTAGMENLSEASQAKIFKDFHKDISNSTQKRVADIKEFQDNPTVKLLLKLCDSSKRWENYKRLAKAEAAFANKDMGDYLKEVLNPRNFLAHGRPVSVDGGQMFSYNGKDYIYNDQVSIQLRVLIGKYRKQFAKIHDDNFRR